MVAVRTALFVLLALALHAAASQGVVHGSAGLPVSVEGNAAATATDSRILLSGSEGRVDMEISSATGSITRVIHRAWGFVTPGDPAMEVLWGDRVDRESLTLEGATLSLGDRDADFRFVAFGSDAVMTNLADGPLLVGMQSEAQIVDHQLDRTFSLRLDPPSDDDNYQHFIPAGLLVARSTAADIVADGEFQIFAYGADFVLDTPSGPRAIESSFRVEERPGAVYDPLSGEWIGAGSHQEYVQEYLLVHVLDGHAAFNVLDAPALILADRTGLVVEGSALLPQARASVRIEEDQHRIASQDLILEGRFSLHLQDADIRFTRTEFNGAGDFTAVRYASTQANYDWAAVLTFSTVAVAALAWVASQFKWLGGGLVAGYARVQGSKVLQHPGRSQVYDSIKATPGVSFSQLADIVPFGESTLNYHVRVLEKNEFVNVVKDGRHLRYFDRQSGLYSNDRKIAVSALRNVTTARIAGEIIQQPGIVQRDLAARFGIAPSTVHWHIRRLQQVGLVDTRRDHPHTRYFAGEAWMSLPHDEQARFGMA